MGHTIIKALLGFVALVLTSCGMDSKEVVTVPAPAPACECSCTDCECAEGKDCFCQSCDCTVDPDDKDGDGKPDHEPGGGGCPDGACPAP